MYQPPKIVKRVGEILKKPIPYAPEDLDEYVRELLGIRVELAESVVEWGCLVAEKRKQMLWPKDAETKLTELDRTVRLEGDIAFIEKDYKFLVMLEKYIEQQLTMIVALKR